MALVKLTMVSMPLLPMFFNTISSKGFSVSSCMSFTFFRTIGRILLYILLSYSAVFTHIFHVHCLQRDARFSYSFLHVFSFLSCFVFVVLMCPRSKGHAAALLSFKMISGRRPPGNKYQLLKLSIKGNIQRKK